jgi:hypothetical protein
MSERPMMPPPCEHHWVSTHQPDLVRQHLHAPYPRRRGGIPMTWAPKALREVNYRCCEHCGGTDEHPDLGRDEHDCPCRCTPNCPGKEPTDGS